MPPPTPLTGRHKNIFVQLPSGETKQWVSGPWTTIEGIKSVVAYRWGIPVDQQRFALEVPNDRKVSDLANVTNEIHFILLPIYQEPPPRKGKREMEEEETPDKLN